MEDTRKWISASVCLPKNWQKIYYFCDRLGIFRGEFHIDNSSISNPNKFISDYGVLDADDIQYWMPYDHAMRDMIPLPPNYNLVDNSNSQPMINSGLDLSFDEVEIPTEHRQLVFSYDIIGDINE